DIKDLSYKFKTNSTIQSGISLSLLKAKQATLSLSEVFGESHGYIDEFRFYALLFNKIQHIITQNDTNCNKASDWIEKNYKSQIKDFYTNTALASHKKCESYNVFYILEEDLLVHFDFYHKSVQYLFKNSSFSTIKKINKELGKYKTHKKRTKPTISLLVDSGRRLSIENLEITKPKLNIEDNYNDDFINIHQTILSRLQKNKDKGLVLLHGKPGTGKTSYIRYLITSV